MTNLTALNQCLAWLTQPVTPLNPIDGLILCGNSLPLTTQLAAQLASKHHLPTMIITGGIGHATKYLRQNLQQTNNDSEAKIMAAGVRHAGYQGDLRLDPTSTNTGENARHALTLVPAHWHNVLLVQDPLLARRTQLTFESVWGPAYHFERAMPSQLQLTTLTPALKFTNAPAYDAAWQPAYFTELLLGELQRLWDTPTGYGPKGQQFIPHVDLPQPVLTAYQTLTAAALQRHR
ncbi:S-adenosyl-L-methionine-binding protein [Lactobacillus sp. CBA3606]|uniref:YdcF family protein n=1 Tax=Lactobacillus sp. CBA3606 TaxID=2099789 RepID=UPI000CFB70BF|nr:YdcF family protein [Lactobacillus sp. CBA3606]AVK63979.1 S-adenosyl-L-methionine-binding protein [Lactobacillus sp. CBA3606]